MSAHNSFNVIGFLGQDRRLNNNNDTGEVIGMSFSVAVDKRVPDPENPGEWKDDVNWFWINLSAKNRSFDFLMKHLMKGAQVSVQGILNVRHREIEVHRGNREQVEIQRESTPDLIATDVQILRYVKSKDGENSTAMSNQLPPVDSYEDGLMPQLDEQNN